MKEEGSRAGEEEGGGEGEGAGWWRSGAKGKRGEDSRTTPRRQNGEAR